MIYAPVLIPTLCRDKHFIRCIESLKKNSWAKYTDVFIAVDYPASELHEGGYKKICEYLDKGDFSVFSNFFVIKRTENYGSGRNMKELRDEVLLSYDRFIRTDDDAEFSPNFIEYMDKCLDKYEKDQSIIAVTGYSYPLSWDILPDCNALINNFICPMWGTGFWREKFREISEKLYSGYLTTAFARALKERKYKKMIDSRFLDFVTAGLGKNKGLTWMTSDVAFGVYMAIDDRYIVMPSLTKVRNYGFDGSGEYCQNIASIHQKKITALNYDYSKQEIDENDFFELHPDERKDCSINKNKMNRFDYRPKTCLLKAKLKVLLYRILGQKGYECFILRKKED